jgi:hypothetical protein
MTIFGSGIRNVTTKLEAASNIVRVGLPLAVPREPAEQMSRLMSANLSKM